MAITQISAIQVLPLTSCYTVVLSAPEHRPVPSPRSAGQVAAGELADVELGRNSWSGRMVHIPRERDRGEAVGSKLSLRGNDFGGVTCLTASRCDRSGSSNADIVGVRLLPFARLGKAEGSMMITGIPSSTRGSRGIAGNGRDGRGGSEGAGQTRDLRRPDECAHERRPLGQEWDRDS